MNWGLKQGIIGGAQRTLSPSMTAVGPNTYLSPRDFGSMLLLALFVHGVVLGIASLMPRERVIDIPVQALTFKIGDTERIAAYAPVLQAGASAPVVAAAPVPQASVKPVPAPAAAPPATAREWDAAPVKVTYQKQPQPAENTGQKVVKIPEGQRQLPVENRTALTAPASPSGLPSLTPLMDPQRHVRDFGAAPTTAVAGTPQGTVGGAGLGAAAIQQIRERYEQQISGWIEQHKLYPASARGAEGKAVVRMRIDRRGYVRYYALEESSGNAALDAAAVDMVRRANPVPAAPAEYPAGNLIEFLIPIAFRDPR